jgi:3-oxoadipate enol-lactonase
VLVGEQDQPFLAPSDTMAATIPGAALVVIADAGHSPQFEAPDAWWGALTGFLDALPSAPARESVA